MFHARRKTSVTISAGSGPDDRVLDHSIELRRVPRLPEVCTPLTANTAAGNFEVFSQTFKEHYISFAARGVDWDSVVESNRQRLARRPSGRELFELLDSMIKPLGDLHAGVEAPALKLESKEPFRAGTDRVVKGGLERFERAGRRELFSITDASWEHGPIRSFCRGQLQFTLGSHGVGYLRIFGFGGYARQGGDARALESALDRIFSEPGLKSLIIDVRLAFGGNDGLGRLIAARLTDRKYLAYAIQARSDPADPEKWTAARPVFIEPSSRPGFRGTVVELIGPITMSAAETFSEALMGRSPHVVTVGESTQGLFCDPLDRRLPNGWIFGLPNAVYRTAEGRAFDVDGIPPEIPAAVFADADVAARRDPALAVAIGLVAR